MDLSGAGKRVRIYIAEHDRAGRQSLWEALLRLLHESGAAGATVFRGQAGFGAHSRIHMARLADVLPDLPIVVEWIDDAARVERLLPKVSALVEHGAITVENVTLVKYSPHPSDDAGPAEEDAPP